MAKYYDIDTSLWRSLVSISKTGSLTATAALLFRTPSAISMQIKRLEDLVGARLVQRHNTGVTLTTAGIGLLEYATKILKLNDEAFHSIENLDHEIIKIGMPDDYAAAFLPQILERFYKVHPNVHVEVTCKTSRELLPLLSGRKIDMAVVGQPQDQPGGITLRKEQLHWVGKLRSALTDCVPLVTFNEGCICRDIALEALEKYGLNWRIMFSSHNNAAIYSAVRAGIGITVSERMLIPEGVGKLENVALLPPLPAIHISVHFSSNQISVAASQLLEEIKKTFDDATIRVGELV